MKSFIVAALMASTVIAAVADATTDAAKTAAVGRTAGMRCDGAKAAEGCGEGLRCHTGVASTKLTPEEDTAAKKAVADKKVADDALDAASKKAIDANAAAMAKWNAL